VKLNNSSLHGITTLSDSWPGGSSTEPARSTVAFGPGGADVRAGRVVGDVEIEAVARDAQRCRARSFRKAHAFRARYGDAVSARLAGDEVGPPNVGEPDVIDVGIHS
jgi:hypothetical protein